MPQAKIFGTTKGVLVGWWGGVAKCNLARPMLVGGCCQVQLGTADAGGGVSRGETKWTAAMSEELSDEACISGDHKI